MNILQTPMCEPSLLSDEIKLIIFEVFLFY